MYKLLLATMLLVGALASGCAREEAREVRETVKKDTQEVQEQGKQLPIDHVKVNEIQWVANITEGLRSARQANKPLLVYFHADWCGWCKRMVQDTYSAEEVIGLSYNFICVKVDTDKDPQASRDYKVSGLPTTIFLDTEGKVIKKIVGFRSSADLAELMKEIIKDAGSK